MRPAFTNAPDDMKRPRPSRIAQLWTPREIVDVEIVGEWPSQVAFGEWVYLHGIHGDGTPNSTRGRRTGIEFLQYNIRRAVTCDDVGALLPEEYAQEAATR